MTNDMLIRSEGMRILADKMGLVEAEKFISLILRDNCDYTKWQSNLYNNMTIEELVLKARYPRTKLKKYKLLNLLIH